MPSLVIYVLEIGTQLCITRLKYSVYIQKSVYLAYKQGHFAEVDSAFESERTS